jgi:ParB family chromosome partitioning protein
MTKKSFKIQANLAQALDETVNSAHNNAGELFIQAIPIKKIKIDPHNPRELELPVRLNESIEDLINHVPSATISKLGLDSLAESIKTQGVINPILVYKNNDHYQLIAGHRRTLAAVLAQKIDIPAKILNHKPDELQISQLQWIENIEREDLSLWERLCNLEKIVSSFKKIT